MVIRVTLSLIFSGQVEVASCHHWPISAFKATFVLVRILNNLPIVLYSQPLLKDSLSL